MIPPAEGRMESDCLKILLLEDCESDALLLLAQLRRDRFRVEATRVETRDGFLATLETVPDLILSDHQMPQFTALDALQLLGERKLDIPFIIVSGTISDELAVAALHQGAADYLHKDRLARLGAAVSRALEQRRLREEKRAASEALMESEARMRHLLESTAEAIYGLDRDGNCTFCNPAALRLFGYEKPHDLLGRNMHEQVRHSREDGSPFPQHECAIFQSLQKGDRVHLEGETLWRSDGTSFYAESWSHPVHRHGEIAGSVVTVFDITARKAAADALSASERHYRLLFDNSPIPVMVYDEETLGILAVNAAMLRNYGYSHEELQGMSVRDLYFEDDLVKLSPEGSQGALSSGVLRHRRKDGSVIEAELTSHPLDFSGRPAQLVQAVDVTERHRAEKRIREQASLLDLAHDAIVVRNLNNEIEFWSKGAERLYGWNNAEALGRRMVELVYTNKLRFETAQRHLLESGEWYGEMTQQSKGKKQLVVMARWTLLRDEEGKPTSVLVINTDITEKKELEAQFLRAQRLESIGTLAGGVAHDLNNILAPILMSASMLHENMPASRREEYVNAIEHSAMRAAHVLRQVLTFARGVEGERISLRPALLINEVAEMARQTFPKSINIRCSLPQSLWCIVGDSTRLHQVLLNLAVNARDAMEQGGELSITAKNFELEAPVTWMPPNAKLGPYVAIAIADTGIGMPEEIIQKMFDPFFTTKGLGRGTGLGLSTSLGIIKSHGGFLKVESRVGVGTTITLFFPASETATQIPYSKRPVPRRGNGEWVMVVDDEEGVREMVKTILFRGGYNVITANDGTQALAEVVRRSSEIHVILADVIMPAMDGVVLTRILRGMNSTVPIIASSGVDSEARTQELKALGVENFLVKPYSSDQLLSAVASVLGR